MHLHLTFKEKTVLFYQHQPAFHRVSQRANIRYTMYMVTFYCRKITSKAHTFYRFAMKVAYKCCHLYILYVLGVKERESRKLSLVKIHDKQFVCWCQFWWLTCEFSIKIANVSCIFLKKKKQIQITKQPTDLVIKFHQCESQYFIQG